MNHSIQPQILENSLVAGDAAGDYEQVITDSDYAVKYNTDSWHSDCADHITSEDPERNDAIRYYLDNALYWIEAMDNRNDANQRIKRSTALQDAITKLGTLIVENAIENKVTREMLNMEDA
jgi:hypothetical protein